MHPKQVIKLASEGWKIVEIADHFGVSRDVIHERFATEIRKGKDKLKSTLRIAQVRAAKQGNGTMLVWLGKQYLGQSDTSIDEYLLEAIELAGLTKEDLLDLIKNKDQITAARPKRSFHEFVKTAGYPPPYDKQVEMMKFGMEEEVPRLLLGARGYGKSDYAVILGIAYRIYLYPDQETNLIITKSKERNASMLREIHEACAKNGVAFDRANATHLRATGLQGKDHSVSAVTIKTVTLRGRHPKRVVMDDPVTEDDTAEAARLLAKKKYNEVMKLAMNVFIIGQPAHQYDLYADLRGIVKTMEVPHGTFKELDADLEALRAAGVDEASISASYFLKVLTEGTSPFNAIRYVVIFPTGDASIAFIDPSEGGDYTAMTILKAYMQGVAVVGYVWKKPGTTALTKWLPSLPTSKSESLPSKPTVLATSPSICSESSGQISASLGKHSSLNKHSKIMWRPAPMPI